MDYPRAGAHYPRSTGEFLAWFRTDEDCLDYLEWPALAGRICLPALRAGRRLAAGRRADRVRRVRAGSSVTAGTIFDKTRTPLTVWFHACWLFATAKDGISAQHLQRALEIGSYHTAWAMLHRLRPALVRPGRDRLAGAVEVDETFIGGKEQGLRGGRQRGKKVLTGIAVEVFEPKGIGRCRMAVLADAWRITAPVRDRRRRARQPRHHRRLERLLRPRRAWATPTSGAASGPPAPAGTTPASCCPPSTGSPPCASGGCWGHIKGQWTPLTCRLTCTSSPSGSTAAAPAAAAWCSTRCWNSRPGTTRFATPTSSPSGSPGTSRRYGAVPVTRQTWNGLLRTGPGEPPRCSSNSRSR